jgi:hypothetical protein
MWGLIVFKVKTKYIIPKVICFYYTATVSNFMGCGFVALYYKILTYTYIYSHSHSKWLPVVTM